MSEVNQSATLGNESCPIPMFAQRCYNPALGYLMLTMALCAAVLNTILTHVFSKLEKTHHSAYAMLKHSGVCLISFSALAVSRSFISLRAFYASQSELPWFLRCPELVYYFYVYPTLGNASFCAALFFALLYFFFLYEKISNESVCRPFLRLVKHKYFSVIAYTLLLFANTDKAMRYRVSRGECLWSGQYTAVCSLTVSKYVHILHAYSFLKIGFFIFCLLCGLYPLYCMRKFFRNVVHPLNSQIFPPISQEVAYSEEANKNQKAIISKAKLRSYQFHMYLLSTFLGLVILFLAKIVVRIFFMKRKIIMCSSPLYIIFFYTYFLNFLTTFILWDGNVKREFLRLFSNVFKFRR